MCLQFWPRDLLLYRSRRFFLAAAAAIISPHFAHPRRYYQAVLATSRPNSLHSCMSLVQDHLTTLRIVHSFRAGLWTVSITEYPRDLFVTRRGTTQYRLYLEVPYCCGYIDYRIMRYDYGQRFSKQYFVFLCLAVLYFQTSLQTVRKGTFWLLCTRAETN